MDTRHNKLEWPRKEAFGSSWVRRHYGRSGNWASWFQN